MDPAFDRALRGFGLIKQPRVGRSDPALASKWIHDEDNWLEASNDSGSSAYAARAAGEKEENMRNLENYPSTQRRDSNAPWAFFLITPNFQNMDQQQEMDNLISQLDHGSDYANEE